MNEKSRKKSWQEKRNTCLVVLIVIFVVLLSALIIMLKLTRLRTDNTCNTEECVLSSVFFSDIINNASDRCSNFYSFSCGSYKGPSTLQEAQDELDMYLKSLITDTIFDDDPLAVKSQKKYYRACMDTKGIEEDGNGGLKRVLEELGGWPLVTRLWNDTSSWGQLLDKCVGLGLYYDWFVNVENEPTMDSSFDRLHIKPPDNAIFVTNEANKSYHLLIESVVNILGSTESISVDLAEIRAMVNFENNLSQVVRESQSDAKETTLWELKEKFPGMPWQALLKNVVIDENTTIVSSIDGYIPRLEILLAKTSNRVKTNYILWKIIQSLYEFLSSDIRKAFQVDADLRHNKKSETRAQYCYGITNTVFAYVSEAAFARKYAPERLQVRQTIDNIENVLKDHIKSVKWMNETHKEYALSKLENMTVMIGGPEEMYDEETFDELLGIDKIDILHLKNTLDVVRSMDKSRDKYNLNFRKQKINYKRARFYQSVASIESAKYLPEQNMIYVPAASLSGIFYSANRPSASNYGTLGTIIAHEMLHGFGILDSVVYNPAKEIVRWSNSTFEAFFNATECLMEDCEEFAGNGTNKINCQSTFDENFADYASIDISYEAFKKTDDTHTKSLLPGLAYTPNQLFWISYASSMCNNLVFNDTEKSTHMLPHQRIIGSYRNSRYFAGDFGCVEGSDMNPKEKCTVL